MSKTISILGSTGSIGRQTLDVAEQMGLRVAALTAQSSVERLEEQARKGFEGTSCGYAGAGNRRDCRASGSRRSAGGRYRGDRRGGHGRIETHFGGHWAEEAYSLGK